MTLAFQQCESHPGRWLVDHLVDVAGRLRTRKRSVPWLPLAGLFHDVGKGTSFFQAHLHGQKAPQDLKRHAQLGAVWLLSYFQGKIGQELCPAIEDLALAHLFVNRHHGRLDDLVDTLNNGDAKDLDRFKRQLVSMDCEGVRRWLETELGETIPLPEPTQNLIALRVQLLKALKTGRSDVEAMGRFQTALACFGSLIESDRDSAAGFSPGTFEVKQQCASKYIAQFRASGDFGSVADTSVSAAREMVFQSAVAQVLAHPANNGRLWSLTVPTGAGKTLAAVGWAVGRREARVAAGLPHCPIIYALPFTSIIDQNAAVVRKLWSEAKMDESLLAIHHHLSELGDLAQAGEESLARSWVEGWRADIVCTTFVQVANALFHGTCADARRFSNLAGSILILDEVQAIPAELWPVFRVALKSLSENFGTDILLVTATQPALFTESDKTEIGPQGFPPAIGAAFDRYDLKVEIGASLSTDALETRIRDELRGHATNSCLVVLNTVQESLDLYNLLSQSDLFRQYRLFHLSTNLRPKDRRRILRRISECSQPHMLVATQVVEAGVDLSFDLVFRALAPLDSIIQAAGRCNRHGIGQRGRVIVVNPAGNSCLYIYGKLHIDVARRLLGKVTADSADDWIAEPDLPGLVTQYFDTLNDAIQRDSAAKIMEAVHQFQFAALRGEGEDKDRKDKCIQLIEDQADRVPHFIETDDSDVQLWKNLLMAFSVTDPHRRRRQLRALRNEVGQRIVEVPRRFGLGTPDDHWLVHVPIASSSECYDPDTGWIRKQ
ncbi:MAG: CRISPR-associated helicase Cas3' [Acidobacteria bacterium]|nr:CRISPR-associated helicase Cas3' [Acidobacteriota bacterium]